MSDLRPTPSRKRMAVQLFWFLVLFALVVYLSVLLALASKQRSFLYHPSRSEESEMLGRAGQHWVQPWRDAQGTLIGWKRQGQEGAPNRMLLLHGNAGDALSRTYLMEALSGRPAFDFYSLEYPGYGSRAGSANQSEIVAAANAALMELVESDRRPLYIAGESLGSGVACLLAGQHPDKVDGLLLITPFTSIADVAASQFPIFPVRLVLQDNYEAAQALKSYSGRVAVLLAGEDEIVPTRFGQALFEGYSGPKKLWVEPGAGH
jgi:pimeloyl-ACP methyl ester carboxylesterase